MLLENTPLLRTQAHTPHGGSGGDFPSTEVINSYYSAQQSGAQPMELDFPGSNPGSLLTSCVTLNKVLNLSEPQSPLCGVETLVV